MQKSVFVAVKEASRRVTPTTSAVLGGELFLQRFRRSDPARTDQECLVVGEALALQHGNRIAQVSFEFLKVLGAEMR